MNTNHSLEALQRSFQIFFESMDEKYRPWLYERPLFLSRDRVAFLQKSQGIMLRLMKTVAENYADLADHLPHEPRVKAFLKGLQGVPFQEGTFRTDFVVNEQNEIRLIEVTCRFPLNGYFRSIAASALHPSRPYEEEYGIQATPYARPFLEKFLGWIGDASRIVIIKGHDCRDNESVYLPSILSQADVPFQVCSYEEWLQHGANWLEGSAIVAELTFEEWLDMPLPLIRAMLRRPFLNDPRLVFTVHDKGFFALANIEAVTDKILSAEETAFIQNAFAETYLASQHPDVWEAAASNPSDWILKPRILGRSVDILAGSLTTEPEWRTALNAARKRGDSVLQKWHLSKKITGDVRGQRYEDYFAGTLLYWGSEFFGPGLFRASSHPISNVKDNRMATSIVDRHANPALLPDLQWM